MTEPFVSSSAPLCLVLLTYRVPAAAIEAAMADHGAWATGQYAAGAILIAGRRVSFAGSMILFRGEEAAVRAAMDAEPFVAQGLATAEVMPIMADMTSPAIAALLE